MATHSSIFAWEIPRTEELDGLQSRDHKRVERDLMTKQQQAMCLERWKDTRVWAHQKHGFDVHLGCLVPGSCFSPS